MAHTGSFIDGEWITPDSSKTIRNINPADTTEVIAEFPAAGREETLRAIEAAKKAYSSWRSVPAPERGRFIARAVEIARKRIDEIAETITREEGKILAEARGETLKGINVLEYYAGAGFRLGGKTLPSEVPNTATYTIRQPLGVAGLITPWNFPWAIPCWKIAPALVAGNTVVFKPASSTPATATILIEILIEAGIPSGVLNMVVGSGSDVGKTIVEHPDVPLLSFTGSNDVGSALYESGSRKGAKVTCEMGGKNPLVALADADVEKAAKAVIAGAFGSTGQRCTATSRLIVHPSIKEKMLEIICEKARTMVIGNGLDPKTEMGPSVDENQFNTVLNYIEIGKKEGAKLLVGGEKAVDAGNGYFVQPTVFDGVTRDMRIFQEEIFGPVLSVVEAETLEEAIDLANDVKYGLTSSIFTSDINAAMKFVEEVHSGMTHVNEPTIGGEAQLPFGGVKATGVGDREMAEEGINFFTELKTVFINYAPTGERSMIR
ncbi:MAG: aldehyde dehydrogenase family protein [Candidatus Hydrogenedentota bacterium]|nr:MAG: aldehyde dehydrogenase family protein [Candidatus Hydrogenedentota bacterium]